MAKNEEAKQATDENACQARGGTEEQQNPNRTPGMAAKAKAMQAADAAAGKKAEAEGE